MQLSVKLLRLGAGANLVISRAGGNDVDVTPETETEEEKKDNQPCQHGLGQGTQIVENLRRSGLVENSHVEGALLVRAEGEAVGVVLLLVVAVVGFGSQAGDVRALADEAENSDLTVREELEADLGDGSADGLDGLEIFKDDGFAGVRVRRRGRGGKDGAKQGGGGGGDKETHRE